MSQILSEVQESLKEEITCRICLDLLKDPRALPCTHVYCKECLQRELTRCQSLSTTLRCPECRREAQISGNNVEDLSRDFRTVRLRAVFEKLCPGPQPTDDLLSQPGATFDGDVSSGINPTVNAGICEVHQKPLSEYCITCRDVLCQECENAHRNHTYHHLIEENVIRKDINSKIGSQLNDLCDRDREKDYTRKSNECKASLSKVLHEPITNEGVSQAVPVHERMIDPAIQKELDKISSAASEIEPKVSVALVEATKVHSDVEHQGHACHIQVDAIFEGMIQLLHERRQNIHREIDEELRKKGEVLVQQKEQLTTTYRELVTISDTCCSGTVRDQGSALQLLVNFQRVSERAKELTCKPTEKADIGKCLTKDGDTVKACCKNCTFKVCIPDISRCQLDGEFLKNPEADNKQFNLRLRVFDAKGFICASRYNQVEGELACIRDKSKILARVLCVQKGTYNLLFTTSERGRHTLSVRVNHILMPQCPLSLYLEKRPQTYSAPFHQIDNLNGPTGLQIYMQDLVVSEEYSFTISMYHEDGSRSLSLEMGGEFAADVQSKLYFVANAISYQLFKFDANGFRLHGAGAQGRNPGQFQNPGGMHFQDGELFVADSANHRIQVFDRDLHLLRLFGQEGNKNGSFYYPRDVIVDSNGDLYVTDMLNDRIQVLTKTGLFIRNIKKKGKERTYPHTPYKIKIHRDYLFITEHHSNSVCVFTKSGDFVTTFGEEYLVKPDGIAVSEDGHVYVSSNKEKIFVF